MYLVCGEALVDVFASPADDLLSPRTEAHVGGSPLNVAIRLARVGREVGFLSQISRDMFGQQLMALLDKEGVRSDYIQRVDHSTTLSVVARDAQGQPDYAFYTRGADSSLSLEDIPPLSADIQVIHVGSYSLVAGTTGAALAGLLAREQHRFIALDPNIRLNVEPDVQRWKDQLTIMLPHVRMVKASDEDLTLLYGADHNEQQVVQAWLDLGPDLVIITKGGQGATAYRQQDVTSVAAPEVTVVDTVGAGDCFQATLLDQLAVREGQVIDLKTLSAFEIETALKGATGAAAWVCQQKGAL